MKKLKLITMYLFFLTFMALDFRLLFFFLEKRHVLPQAEDHVPRVGDVYCAYLDYRNDEYARTNGFAAEYLIIMKINEVTNGRAYWSSKDIDISGMTNAPYTYPGGGGSVSNFFKYKEYHTLVKPTPLS